MNYNDFINLEYKPGRNDLNCLFRITPSKSFKLKDAAIRVAAESSNGTWSNLKPPKHVLKLKATVYEINKNFVKIAYPVELFEAGNMSQILSSIAGNIFGMKAVKGLRLEDVHWPKKLIKSFKGPKYGITGVKELFKKKKGPITATVPKPKVGYYPEEHARIGYEAWVGGIDLLKDDENLTNQKFNKFEKRLKKSMKKRDEAEKETGDKKSYLINITGETEEMKKRLKLVADYGNEYVMIDTLTAGWAATQTIRNLAEDYDLRIHAHRAFHSAFDRNPLHGVSMKVLCEVARLQGVDQLHIGGLGKLAGDKEEVSNNHAKCSLNENKETKLMLGQKWHGLNKVLSVCSGGLHPGILQPLLDLVGEDICIQVGGGIHGHPGGTHAGAKAVIQSINAYKQGISVKEYSKKHEELKQALEHWGKKVYK